MDMKKVFIVAGFMVLLASVWLAGVWRSTAQVRAASAPPTLSSIQKLPTRITQSSVNVASRVEYTGMVTYFYEHDQSGNIINDLFSDGTYLKFVIQEKNRPGSEPIITVIRAMDWTGHEYEDFTYQAGGKTYTKKILKSIKTMPNGVLYNRNEFPALYETKLVTSQGTVLVVDNPIAVPSKNGSLELCVDADADEHASTVAYNALSGDHKEAMRVTCVARSKLIDDCDDADPAKKVLADCAPPPPPPPPPKDTILEYLENGPDCTGREQQCPSLYRQQFKELGISDEDVQTKFNSVIASSFCNTATQKCRAWVCNYEFNGVDVGGAPPTPRCGGASCSAYQASVARFDALPKILFESLRWKRGNESVESRYFLYPKKEETLGQSVRSFEIREQWLRSNGQVVNHGITCPSSPPTSALHCADVQQCQEGCQDLDDDGVAVNPGSARCKEQIRTGALSTRADCDDNNPTVDECTCPSDPWQQLAKVSLWARSAPGEKPVPVTAVSIGDVLNGRLTMVVDLGFDPGCLPKAAVAGGWGNYEYRVPGIVVTPFLKGRYGHDRALMRLKGKGETYLKPFRLYNEGGKLQSLLGDIHPHEDFAPIPDGDDKRIGTARRRFTATIEVDTGKLLESVMSHIISTPINEQLVKKFREIVLGLASVSDSERTKKIKQFLSQSARDFILANFEAASGFAYYMSDHPLRDATGLRIGFALDDVDGKPIPGGLVNARSNSYPITTDRKGEMSDDDIDPNSRTIENAQTLGDILHLIADGSFTEQVTTFLTDPTLWRLFGSTPEERIKNLNELFDAIPTGSGPQKNQRGKAATGAARHFSKEQTNVVALPMLVVAECKPDDCSQFALSIEQQLLSTIGRLPNTTMVVFAKGVGQGVIKHQREGLIIYFTDGTNPDWPTLKRVLGR